MADQAAIAEEVYSRLDLEILLNVLEAEACRAYDGHYTILKFTTHFKVGFGTPDEVRKEVERLKAYPSLRLAIIGVLVTRQTFYWEGRLRSKAAQ